MLLVDKILLTFDFYFIYLTSILNETTAFKQRQSIMKKLIYILLFLFPVVAFAQQPWYKSPSFYYIWMNVGNVNFSAGESDYPSLALNSSGIPYVAYKDYANSKKATVMQFDGTNWVNVGNVGFSAGQADYTSIAFSPTDGEPYVAYCDWGNSDRATVMKYDGTNWVNVGTPGFTTTQTNGTCLAFSITGQPYVAYNDISGSATVMKFDGTNWVFVGTPDFSAGMAQDISLALNRADSLPYVAYQDFGYSQKSTVMRFNGTSWVNVGNAGFSAGAAYYTSLAFSPFGQPYVAYEDDANSDKATVMMFNGINWVNVGNAGFSVGNAPYTSLAFSPSDSLPNVAFEDWMNSNKSTVMKFDGTNWVNVGPANFSAGPAYNEDLAISSKGEPYIVYTDSLNMLTVMRYDSVSVGINEIEHSRFSLYPNPATDKITVEITGETQESYLAIVNIEGQQLLTMQITQPKTQVDISSLPSDVYFVRLTNDKTVEVGKIIKE